MICIGFDKKLQSELERLVSSNYPGHLSDQSLINIALKYERTIQKKSTK